MTIRVYTIDLDKLDNVKGSDDYSNEDFISIAEEQGTVYTLKSFQDAFNYEESISPFNCYIRFIDTDL